MLCILRKLDKESEYLLYISKTLQYSIHYSHSLY